MNYRLIAFRNCTVVPSWCASKEERQAALPAFKALSALGASLDDMCSRRVDILNIYESISGTFPHNACFQPTQFFAQHVLHAVQSGRLLVVPGHYGFSDYAGVPRVEEPESAEARLTLQIMAGRRELQLDGTSYRVTPVASWTARSHSQEGWEVVPLHEAGALLRRMALQARSHDEKESFAKAAELLVDFKPKRDSGGGLHLLRHRTERTFFSANAEPALTPSQLLKKEQSWVEVSLRDERENPVPGARYELILPDGKTITGSLDSMGCARVDGISPGSCKVDFPDYDADHWG